MDFLLFWYRFKLCIRTKSELLRKSIRFLGENVILFFSFKIRTFSWENSIYFDLIGTMGKSIEDGNLKHFVIKINTFSKVKLGEAPPPAGSESQAGASAPPGPTPFFYG